MKNWFSINRVKELFLLKNVKGIPSGYSAYSARIEYLFTVLPIFLTTLILFFQGKFSQILFGPEWSFISAVLAGQIIVKIIKSVEPYNSTIDTVKWFEDLLLTPEDDRIVLPEWEQVNPNDPYLLHVVNTIVFMLCPALTLVCLTLTSAVTSVIASWILALAHWVLFIYVSYKFFRISIALDLVEFGKRYHEKFLLENLMKNKKFVVAPVELSNEVNSSETESHSIDKTS